MKQEAITLANKVLHDLNFDKHRSTTQIIAEALEYYAQQQVKNLNIPDVRKRLSEIKNWINESMLERDDIDDGVTNREKNANILLGYALKLCDDDL